MGSKMMKPWHGTLKVYRSDCGTGLMFHLDMGLKGIPSNKWTRDLNAYYLICKLHNLLRKKGFTITLDTPEKMRIFTQVPKHYAFLVEETVYEMNWDRGIKISSQYFQG
jgi:hypothetical protein